MARYVVAGIIVIGLAVGVWLLLPRDETSPTTTPPASAAVSTTTSTSTVDPTTATTSEPDSHVVETVEEAEAILRELWFGWFEGIYNQDEDRIREVVATERLVSLALDQFGVMEFVGAPHREGLRFDGTEILRTDERCLGAWATVSAEFRPGGTSFVHVLRRSGTGWKFMNTWSSSNDLWEADCDAVLSP